MAYLHKQTGYMMVGRHTKEHLIVAEKALGKKIPAGAEVHHVNMIRHDNRNKNLVICENRKYHRLLHRRTKALMASGNPNFLKCVYCQTHDHPDNIAITNQSRGSRFYHKKCHANYERERKLCHKA